MHCRTNFLCGTAERSFSFLFFIPMSRQSGKRLSAANILIDSTLSIDAFPLIRSAPAGSAQLQERAADVKSALRNRALKLRLARLRERAIDHRLLLTIFDGRGTQYRAAGGKRVATPVRGARPK